MQRRTTVERDQLVIVHISGHFQKVHVSMIEELIAKDAGHAVLDLAEVTLVDVEVVRFLGLHEAKGRRTVALLTVHTRVGFLGASCR